MKKGQYSALDLFLSTSVLAYLLWPNTTNPGYYDNIELPPHLQRLSPYSVRQGIPNLLDLLVIGCLIANLGESTQSKRVFLMSVVSSLVYVCHFHVGRQSNQVRDLSQFHATSTAVVITNASKIDDPDRSESTMLIRRIEHDIVIAA
ncbi:Hypothetical protein CINCED_3A014503 [Cinara cedri]|uniref:Uncharacterized protein n=1 Tax=Cinara cedri TaxID=506608 RepID=A0A5E4N8D8_9HEMI|nr:Hypothetical protein CINCED_3A014503 [Cinara cedri]